MQLYTVTVVVTSNDVTFGVEIANLGILELVKEGSRCRTGIMPFVNGQS
jgi:hypothetical protein